MGGMVEGLFRVRDEILRLRRERELLLAGREQDTRNRRAAVSRMLARFSRDLVGAADRGRVRRMDFLTDLRQGILRLLDRLEADCGGAREALVRLAGARGGPAARVRLRRKNATDGAAAPARRPPKGKAEAERQEAKSKQHESGRRRGKARRRPRR